MMIPTGAREPKFGTNPIAWAAPSGTSGEAPFLFDVAVSNVVEEEEEEEFRSRDFFQR